MRFAEILNELTYGKVSPNVSTIDRSAPWVKKGIEKAAERTKTFRRLNTVAEKLEFLYKETDGFTKSLNIRPVFIVKGKRLPFQSFDASTGELILKNQFSNSQRELITYKFNINDFEFDRREKSTSNVSYYIFKSDVDGEEQKNDNPNFRPGNTFGRNAGSGKIKKPSDEFNKISNNPFGL
jgi:hypothetical protein